MDISGRSLKQYRLLGKLGQGGMGVVYRAFDTVLGRDAAVKVLPPDKLHDDGLRQRFHREARAASALNHPNIITIYEIGSDDGIEFMAMEYVDGRTLHSVLRSERLTIAKAAGYATQVAEALSKAHAAGIVHRDLKPGNLMITGDGLVKVLDFGLARLNLAANQMSAGQSTVYVTRVGTVMGTLAYMSPEQARGEEAGAQSDVFSLGVVLFEMLSGELPFSGNSEIAMLHNLHFGKPKDLKLLRPDVPPELARIVARMLQHNLDTRYGSMAEVRQELRGLAGSNSTHASSGEPTVSLPPAERLEAPPWRNRWVVAALSAILVFAGAATLGQRVGAFRVGNWDADRSLAPGELETAEPWDLYLKAREYLDRFDRVDNPDRAIKLLERAVEKDAGFALGYATLTEAYRYRRQLSPDGQWLKLMEQSAKRAIELNGEMAAAHIAMGLASMEQSGRLKESESHLQKAIDLDPRNSAAHRWLGVLLAAKKDLAGAVKSLERAVTLDPKSWAALLDLGIVHYSAADYTKAVDAWNRARKLSEDNLRVLANLTAAYHMLDRYEDAASTIQRAIEIDPSGQHYSNLGTLRFFQGRYAEAISPLEKAVEYAPNRYRYWGNLADAYRWSPGHRSKAPDT